MFHGKFWLPSTRLQRKEAIIFGKCPPHRVADHGTTQRPILLVQQTTYHCDCAHRIHLPIANPTTIKVIGKHTGLDGEWRPFVIGHLQLQDATLQGWHRDQMATGPQSL